MLPRRHRRSAAAFSRAPSTDRLTNAFFPRAPQFADLDSVYCKYSWNYGPDWSAVQVHSSCLRHRSARRRRRRALLPLLTLARPQGIEAGISQVANKEAGGNQTIVWNFPVDMTFRTTEPFGWPQLNLCIIGQDWRGREVICGYGAVHVPTRPGTHEVYIDIFRPLSSTIFQQVRSWAVGTPPEYTDAKFASKGKGRDVTRVKSIGKVRSKFNVVLKNFAALDIMN